MNLAQTDRTDSDIPLKYLYDHNFQWFHTLFFNVELNIYRLSIIFEQYPCQCPVNLGLATCQCQVNLGLANKWNLKLFGLLEWLYNYLTTVTSAYDKVLGFLSISLVELLPPFTQRYAVVTAMKLIFDNKSNLSRGSVSFYFTL